MFILAILVSRSGPRSASRTINSNYEYIYIYIYIYTENGDDVYLSDGNWMFYDDGACSYHGGGPYVDYPPYAPSQALLNVLLCSGCLLT